MTSQRYEIDILRESVIVGNDAIFKCSIPSFVSDFVMVDSWVDSEGFNLGSSHFGNLLGLKITASKNMLLVLLLLKP